MSDRRITVVIMTRNRRDELLETLARMTALPERVPVIVADNASTDGTGEAVAERFGQVRLAARVARPRRRPARRPPPAGVGHRQDPGRSRPGRGPDHPGASRLAGAGAAVAAGPRAAQRARRRGHVPRRRRQLGIRNTLWTAWLRRPVPGALRHTVSVVRSLPRDRASLGAVAEALGGLRWVLRERRVVPPEVERGRRLLEAPQGHSVARRYVG